VRRVYRRAIVKRKGAQIFAHGLIHDDVAVHHTRLNRLRRKANRKAKSRKPYAPESKSHFLMPQQRIARTESRLCGGAFTAAFLRLKRENSGIQLSALC